MCALIVASLLYLGMLTRRAAPQREKKGTVSNKVGRDGRTDFFLNTLRLFYILESGDGKSASGG